MDEAASTLVMINPLCDVKDDISIDIEDNQVPHSGECTSLLPTINSIEPGRFSDHKKDSTFQDYVRFHIEKDKDAQPHSLAPSVEKESETENKDGDASKIGHEVQFLVGQGKQPMTGRDSELAVISPVFGAMFTERWRTSDESASVVVEISDVDSQAFAVILRYASHADDLHLTEDNVWHVLKAADMYQVSDVVDRCFHFLLRSHPRRHRSHHICVVLEMAHQLNYTSHYEQCMNTLKQNAGQVFKNCSALGELCYHCMFNLIRSDDLAVSEILIHDAVLTWVSCACARRGENTPSFEMMRVTAGNLVYQIRYLAMPRRILQNLENKNGRISSLLTNKEINSLLSGDVRNFPESVNSRRQSGKKKVPCNVQKAMNSVCTYMFIAMLFLLLVFALIYFPVAYALKSSSSDQQ